MPKQRNLIKFWGPASCYLGLTSLIGFSSYETFRTYKILTKPLNSNVLVAKRSEFIYIKHDFFREPVKDVFNEFFQDDEPKINGFLYNIKKKLMMTKLEYALKTLRLAKNTKDPYLRLKALRLLAKVEGLEDWEFQYLAQYCDGRTIVSLARLECNVNLISSKPKEFHKTPRTKTEIVNTFKAILDHLSDDECVQFIIDSIFSFEKVKEPDDDGILYHGYSRHNDLIVQTLDALLHLTTKSNICDAMAKMGVLEMLMDIHKHFENNLVVKLVLNKIITNMTSCPNLLEYFHKSGWLYLLSCWQTDEDLRIQVLSSTALTNLERSDPFDDFLYKPKVYPLHPLGKCLKTPEMDLIFVHGLLGGIFITWRQQRDSDNYDIGVKHPKLPKSNGIDQAFQKDSLNLHNSFYEEEAIFKKEKILKMESEPTNKMLVISEETSQEVLALLDNVDSYSSIGDLKLSRKILTYIMDKFKETTYSFCWPLDWVPIHFPNIRILGLNYESFLSMWVTKHCPCEARTGKLVTRSNEYLSGLAEAGIGSKGRPVVWVGHSMGGLIIKYIINLALQSDNPKIRQIGENTRGIIFLGTPHKGSSIAKLSQKTSVLLWPSIEVQDMEENSKELLKMHEEFLSNVSKYSKPIEIVSIAEGSPTKVFQNIKLNIVPLDSSYLGVGDFYVSSENHLNLSKPLSKSSFIYLKLIEMIEKIMTSE